MLQNNEDYIHTDDSLGIYLLADGMGGGWGDCEGFGEEAGGVDSQTFHGINVSLRRKTEAWRGRNWLEWRDERKSSRIP